MVKFSFLKGIYGAIGALGDFLDIYGEQILLPAKQFLLVGPFQSGNHCPDLHKQEPRLTHLFIINEDSCNPHICIHCQVGQLSAVENYRLYCSDHERLRAF